MTTQTKPAKLPALGELTQLLIAVKRTIAPDYRAFEDDDIPGIQVTVGWSPDTGDWSYQTGDNSYTGGAYCYPVWGVVAVYRRSNCRELAGDIQCQLFDQA